MCAQGPYTIALVQMAVDPARDRNLRAAEAHIRAACTAGASVVCLPELFLSPYFCLREDAALFDGAEPIPGPTTEVMTALARELAAVLIVPLFERRAAGVYHNSLVVIDADGRIAQHYRKMHIPDDPGYFEKFYFTPGDRGFAACDTRAGRLGALICWDQWFPEAARLVALNGAGVIVYPTAIGWLPSEKAASGPRQLDAWITVQRGHAVANGVYVAAVNRAGLEHCENAAAAIEFWGNSFVCGPQGEVLAQASADREEIVTARIDPARIEAVRREWPFFRDRRPDAYAGLLERFIDGE